MTALRSTGRLVEDFIAVCRRRRSRVKVADSTGAELTGGALLARTLVLRRFLRRTILDADEETVGLLMPPSVGAAVVNVALTLDRRIAVNLNYTLSNEVLNACIRTARIRRVLTTRKVMSKLELDPEAELVFVARNSATRSGSGTRSSARSRRSPYRRGCSLDSWARKRPSPTTC
ncbi:MAG: hypothetical protein ACYS0E_12465 [Planctomycetota bacterium]